MNVISQDDFFVKFGSIQNPYQEFTFTILAGQQMIVNYAHNYFRVISLSGGTLQTRFGASGQFSPYTGAGLGFKIPFVVPHMVLLNSHATDTMTITIAVAIGEIQDDRLQTSGTVTVNAVKATTLDSLADVALNNGSATVVSALDSTRRELIVQNPVANAVSFFVGDSGVTASNGIELQAGDSIVLTTTAAVSVFVTGASKVAKIISVKD